MIFSGLDVSSGVTVDSGPNSVTIEYKTICIKSRNYLSNYLLSPLVPTAISFPFFKLEVRQLQEDFLSVCLSVLSCVVIGKLLWFVAAMVEVGRMINLWLCLDLTSFWSSALLN